MTKIVPAILAKTKEEYVSKLSVVRQLTNRFQLDIIDGEFVDNKTIGLDEVSRLIELRMDVHLMVNNPLEYAKKAITLNVNNIIIQAECGQDLSETLQTIKSAGLNAGVAINPDTELSEIKKYTELLDHVLIMGYEAGFAGQKLKLETLKRSVEAREMFPNCEIGLDGGINFNNAKKALNSGYDVVNVNSAIFGSEDPLDSYSKLLELIDD